MSLSISFHAQLCSRSFVARALIGVQTAYVQLFILWPVHLDLHICQVVVGVYEGHIRSYLSLSAREHSFSGMMHDVSIL